MARDGYTVVASMLTPSAAGMAHQLLTSEGIDALVEDECLSAINPLLQNAIGGAKLLVPSADADRSLKILRDTGALAPAVASPEGEPDIPEEEWSAASPESPKPASSAAELSEEDAATERLARRALAAAVVGFLIPLGGLLQLYSVWLAWHWRRAPCPRRLRGRGKVALALLLDVPGIALQWVIAWAMVTR